MSNSIFKKVLMYTIVYGFLYPLFHVMLYCHRPSKYKRVPEHKVKKLVNLKTVPEHERKYYNHDKYDPIPEQDEYSWLTNNPEHAQTFKKYKKQLKTCISKQAKIYICLLDDVGLTVQQHDDLIDFIQLWFQRQVVITNIFTDDIKANLTSRYNEQTSDNQLLTTDIMTIIEQHKQQLHEEQKLHEEKQQQDDCCAYLVLTKQDLYGKNTNFVFGEANTRLGVGVFSTYRFNCDFNPNCVLDNINQSCIIDTNNINTAKFQMVCHIVVHEIGHMLGLGHCIYYSCNMNGCNSVFELLTQPLHLCPVDLYKLKYALDLDIITRHEHLTQFYVKHNFVNEIAWANQFC